MSLWGWLAPKSVPWWAAFGPLVAGVLALINAMHPLGLTGAILDAGLAGTPPLALIYIGCLGLWANRRFL